MQQQIKDVTYKMSKCHNNHNSRSFDHRETNNHLLSSTLNNFSSSR